MPHVAQWLLAASDLVPRSTGASNSGTELARRVQESHD